MQDSFEETFQIWKVKFQLAKQGSYQALQQIKQHCFNLQKQKELASKINFHQIIEQANIQTIKKNTNYGNYQLYSQVPSFLLLEGTLHLQCINLQGDNQILIKKAKKGIVRVDKEVLEAQFGANNLNLLTKFQLVAANDCIIIQTKHDLQNYTTKTPALNDREKAILDHYFLLPIKNPRKVIVNDQTKIDTKFYMIKGKACYYTDNKQKLILTAYSQGYFNPNQFDCKYKLHIFQNSQLILFEDQFIKDDLILGIEAKRKQHLQSLYEKYNKLQKKSINQIQQKLISRYQLPKKIVDKVIYQIDLKNDLISTSSSIKGKCPIRIKKVTKKKLP